MEVAVIGMRRSGKTCFLWQCLADRPAEGAMPTRPIRTIPLCASSSTGAAGPTSPPEERWWLYTMTAATTGQAMQKDVGWRKALRAALADNPFVKGEGFSPKARRGLPGHAQMTLDL